MKCYILHLLVGLSENIRKYETENLQFCDGSTNWFTLAIERHPFSAINQIHSHFRHLATSSSFQNECVEYSETLFKLF